MVVAELPNPPKQDHIRLSEVLSGASLGPEVGVGCVWMWALLCCVNAVLHIQFWMDSFRWRERWCRPVLWSHIHMDVMS